MSTSAETFKRVSQPELVRKIYLRSTSMIENPVQLTAIHESGHAIAAVHLGVRFQAVELRVDLIDGYVHCGGRLRGAETSETTDNQRLWSELVVIMAGYAAVSLLKPSQGFSLKEFTFPDDRDFAAALEVLGWIQPPSSDRQASEAAMAQAWLQAREVVASNWQRMAAIADELVRRCHPGGELVASHIELAPEEVARLVASEQPGT